MNRLIRWINRTNCLLVILIGVAGVLPCIASAQTTSVEVRPTSLPAFDIVSIRPMREDDNTPTHITNSIHNGYIKAINVNLKALMEVAYDVPDLRMIGGPDWLAKQKFYIEAKADPKADELIAGLSPQRAKQIKRNMLAALLADRFKVVVHSEMREMPIYAMVVAKGGPKLGGNNSNEGALPAGEDRIRVRSGNDSLGVLAYELSWRLGRLVLDRTGLRDRQEITLSWRDNEVAPTDASGPSLFTAIQEQLGLRLESTRGEVSVLRIDHAEKPSEN